MIHDSDLHYTNWNTWPMRVSPKNSANINFGRLIKEKEKQGIPTNNWNKRTEFTITTLLPLSCCCLTNLKNVVVWEKKICDNAIIHKWVLIFGAHTYHLEMSCNEKNDTNIYSTNTNNNHNTYLRKSASKTNNNVSTK